VNPVANKIIAQFTVTNIAWYPVVIPHVREGLIERHGGWWGWGISVNNHQRRPFIYFSDEHRPPMLQQEDLIKLQPGEHLTVSVNIADMRLGGYYVERQEELGLRLADFDGEYEVSASYGLSGSVIPGSLHDILWTGGVKSNTLTFVIVHEKRRMFFPGKESQLVSPDGEYILINVESDSEEQARSLGGKYALYIRDTSTGEQEKLYAYNEHVEALWSPKGGNVLINEYGEITNGSYSSSALIFFVDRKELVIVKDQLRQRMGDNPHIFGNQYIRIMGTNWLSEHVLRVRIQGTGEVDPGSFRQWYEYDVLNGEFKQLETFFPLGIKP
jgi:hypothetical protein